MHIHYTHPQFGEQFLARFQKMQGMMEKHPLFSQKASILTSLNHELPKDLRSQVSNIHALILEEKPLWKQVSFKLDIPYNQEVEYTHKPAIDLSDEQKDFVKKNQIAVKERFGLDFSELAEYMLISSTEEYDRAPEDYAQFCFAADALKQLDQMQQLVMTQEHLAKKIAIKLKKNADKVAPEVESLQASHESQIALMARMPPFKF